MSDAITPTTRDSVAALLSKILKEQLYRATDTDTPVDKPSFNKDADLMEQLGLDSLDQIEIVMAVEEEFDIEVADEMAEKLTTFNLILNHVLAAKGVTA